MHRPWPEHACGTVCKIHWQGLTSIACWVVGFVQWWMLCTGNRRKTSSFEQPGWSYEPIQHTSTSQDGNNITQATVKNLLGLNWYWHLAPNCYGFFGKFAHVHCQCLGVFKCSLGWISCRCGFRWRLVFPSFHSFFLPRRKSSSMLSMRYTYLENWSGRDKHAKPCSSDVFFTKTFLNKWYKYIYIYIYNINTYTYLLFMNDLEHSRLLSW